MLIKWWVQQWPCRHNGFLMNMNQLNMHVKHFLWIQILLNGDKTSLSDRFYRDTVDIAIQMNEYVHKFDEPKKKQINVRIFLFVSKIKAYLSETQTTLGKKLCRWSLLLCELMAAIIISKTILSLPPFYLHKTFWLLLLLAPNLKSLLLLADLIPIIQAFAITCMCLYLCTCTYCGLPKNIFHFNIHVQSRYHSLKICTSRSPEMFHGNKSNTNHHHKNRFAFSIYVII